MFLQLHSAGENFSAFITRVRMRLSQLMLFKATYGEETLRAQSAFKILFMKLVMIFFLVKSFKNSRTPLTLVHLGWLVEVYGGKYTGGTLFVHNHTSR